MTIFDQFFFTIFSHYKPKYKNKANSIALYYTTLLQIGLAFAFGCFAIVFFNKMHVDVISNEKAIIVFVLAAIGIHFKNWIKYSGKTRKVMNAKHNKRKTQHYNLYLLWFLPFACLGFGIILLQAI
jgi:hypothetical protein